MIKEGSATANKERGDPECSTKKQRLHFPKQAERKVRDESGRKDCKKENFCQSAENVRRIGGKSDDQLLADQSFNIADIKSERLDTDRKEDKDQHGKQQGPRKFDNPDPSVLAEEEKDDQGKDEVAQSGNGHAGDQDMQQDGFGLNQVGIQLTGYDEISDVFRIPEKSVGESETARSDSP